MLALSSLSGKGMVITLVCGVKLTSRVTCTSLDRSLVDGLIALKDLAFI